MRKEKHWQNITTLFVLFIESLLCKIFNRTQSNTVKVFRGIKLPFRSITFLSSFDLASMSEANLSFKVHIQIVCVVFVLSKLFIVLFQVLITLSLKGLLNLGLSNGNEVIRIFFLKKLKTIFVLLNINIYVIKSDSL